MDFDLEIGAIDNNIGVYMFYGAFPNAFYQNYGVGVDYYFKPWDSISLSLGNQYHVVIRNKEFKHLGTTSSYFNPRSKLSYNLKFVSLDFIASYTQRNDIDQRLFEGSFGITKKF